MLVIPIGLEESTVRRTPWVTWVLMGTCCALYLLLQVAPIGTSEEEVNQRYGEALHYLAERPYLSVPSSLKAILGPEGERRLTERNNPSQEPERDPETEPARDEKDVEARNRSAARRAVSDEGTKPPPSPELVRAEQEELDALAATARRALGGLPTWWLGFIPAQPRLHTLITSLFMHAGLFHLLGNMLFLFLSGPFIEDAFGRPIYAALYFLTGFAATAAHTMAAPESGIPLVGASGAIAGVMGAFLVRFGTRRIDFLVLPFPLIPAFRFRLRLPAFVVLPLWMGEQFIYATLTPAEGSGVAFWAHVGGFALGSIIALILRLTRVEERFINPAIESRISLAQHPGLERALDARTAGDLVAARREIRVVLAAEPQNPDAWLESWEIGLAEKDGASVGQAGLRLMEIHGRTGEIDLIWDAVGDPRWRLLPGLPWRFVLAAGDFMAREGDGRSALECYRAVSSAAPTDALAMRALISEGEVLVRAGDLSGARSAFDRARVHPACNELWIERMERALKAPPAAQRPNR